MALMVPESEQLLMVRLLKAGIPVSRVADRTGWSEPTVRKVQREHGLKPRPRGERDVSTSVEVDEERIEEEVGDGEGWSPAYDPHVDRPNQRRWLALLATASDTELPQLRDIACKVLGVSRFADYDAVRLALICDRRSADDLAHSYLVEYFRGAA